MERKFELPPTGPIMPTLGLSLKGELNKWHQPVIPVELTNPHTGMTLITEAVIDTGSYDCLINDEGLEKLKMTITHDWEPIGNHPMEGKLMATIHYLKFRFSDMPGRISVTYQFNKMKSGLFNYPVIIGTRMACNFNLRYFGRENRFELDL